MSKYPLMYSFDQLFPLTEWKLTNVRTLFSAPYDIVSDMVVSAYMLTKSILSLLRSLCDKKRNPRLRST